METVPYVLSPCEFEKVFLEDTMNNFIEEDTGEVMLESLEVNGELHSAHRKSNQVCYLMIFFMITFFIYK